MKVSGPGPVRLLLGSFLGIILVGAALLMLPISTPAGQPISWVDALFTATSATCVTGLVVRDTGGGFTLFGQVVIATLIQLGGLGVMTFSLFFVSLFRRRVPLAYRSVMEQTLFHEIGEHWRPLLRMVVVFTLASEAVGATALFVRWLPRMGAGSAAYAAVFHSISAFCNAGFALWPDSLTGFRGDPVVNVTVMALIVLGGLGFFAVYDLTGKAKTLVGPAELRRSRRLTVHTKIALVVSGILISVGALLFWLLESSRSLFDLPVGEQVLASLFQSVTARTAGFNTVDIGTLAPSTLFLLAMLMFIGGSPGSCAGGIKTTTVGVLLLATWSRLRGRLRVNAFHRTLSPTTVRNTLAIALGGIMVVVVAIFLLLLVEAPGQTIYNEQAVFIGFFFETLSALGTVGLSTGVTPLLSDGGKLLLALLMFVGRLGPLTVAAALVSEHPVDDWRYPEEDVMVG